MRIARIIVTKLFGLFSHRLSLNLEDRITIVYGPNGCGKTTLLRMILSLSEGRLHELAGIRFEEFALTFDDGRELRVLRHIKEPAESPSRRKLMKRRRVTSERPTEQAELEFKLLRDGRSVEQWRFLRLSLDQEDSFPLHLVESHVPFLTRVDRSTWQDDRTDELLTLEEIFERFPERLPFLTHVHGQERPAWLKDLLEAFPVYFIQTQRLLRLPTPRRHSSEGERSHRPMVLEYSEELTEQIQRTLAQSVQQSQSLDQSFPIRAFSKRPSIPVTADQIRNKYREQQEKQKRLIAAGLIGPQSDDVLPYRDLQDVELKLLWMYLEDTDKKLAVFDQFLGKIEVLTEMINSRFLYKKLTIDRESGFVFSADDGRRIPLDALSSGEQHELVLTYELLFRVKSGSLILIDEPELSLHVVWQHRFLEDLKRISDLANFDFLVATHSPQIIHKRWDLALSLESEGGGQ